MAYGAGGGGDVANDQVIDNTKVDSDSSDLLALCRMEMFRAVGFDNDAELKSDRERALNYYKGDVRQDIPSLPNRSKAVSSDVSDAVETILPDLMDIFTGGDDVVSFKAQGPQDEDAAKQETAYLNHVVFQENDGFLSIATAVKDALTIKQGIFSWEWCEDIEDQSEDFTGKNAIELQIAAQDGEISNVKPEPSDRDMPSAEPTYSFTVTKTKDRSTVKYYAIDPTDFAAAPDTINIADTTYCCAKSRPRVQDLIAEGFDEEKVRKLPSYSTNGDEQLRMARDTAGESEQNGGVGDDVSDDLRQVEIAKHHIRRLGKDGKLEIWCVVSDVQCTIELDSYKVERIRYASGSPYLVPHRLIGLSVADLLIQIMQIKTSLMRMVLDSGYFALNQRFEVAMNDANDYTISDLLRNEPSVPVRSKTGQTVRPLTSGGLNFDAYKALEYFSTVAEGRTGVVRNAQGLAPDTLHDTAKGAMMLMSAAQRRVRMIARMLAETLFKPFYLGVHAEIRENCTSTKLAELNGKWVQVDPTKWAERVSMTVEVGLGAAGKDAELAAANQISLDVKNIVEVQGGAQGPIVTLQDVYNLAIDKAKKLGVKDPERYYTDPSSPEGQQAQQAMAQRPNPDVMKIQGEQQLQQAKQQGEMALGQMKVQADKEIQANKSQFQAATDTRQQQLEHERMMAQQANEMQLEQLKIASAERIAIAVARIKAEGMIAAAEAKADAQAASDALTFEESHETSTA